MSWLSISRKRRIYERKYTVAVQRSLNVQIAPVIKQLEAYKPSEIEVHLDPGPIRQVFGRLYSDTGTNFARDTYKEITGKARKDDLTDIWMQEMIAFVNQFGGDRIVSITGSSKEIAQKILKELAETVIIPEGLSIEESSRLLQREFKKNYIKTTLARSRVIAKTEVLTASNKGSHVGALDAGAQIKVWQTSGRTSPDGHDRHVAYPGLHGQEREMNEDYDVGGNPASYPGDPKLPAGEVVNCECREVYKMI